ncbi:MAG: nitroreductase family protein [Flavobacteriales bacterium]|nr:nitroreductase family protein [Flavobacteriales bacterium]
MIINGFEHIPLVHDKVELEESKTRSKAFLELMRKRRSLRFYENTPVPDEVIKNVIETAGQAPSGANKQPWTFCVVRDQKIKSKIREMAENEEKINYTSRMSDQWKEDLKPLGTDENKEFLEEAPALIIVFKKLYEDDGGKNYYVNESVGISSGFLIAAIHNAGLFTLTHTPSPMNFLSDVLGRPKNERAFLLLPIGYPRKDATVPDIQRKSLNEIIEFF